MRARLVLWLVLSAIAILLRSRDWISLTINSLSLAFIVAAGYLIYRNVVLRGGAGNRRIASSAIASAPLQYGMAVSTARPVQPRLVATMGVYSGRMFTLGLSGTDVTLGRDLTNSIVLNSDSTVSRHHAAIRIYNGTYILSDEGSVNGVFVNGIRIAGSHPLCPGDEVQIGNTRFRFEV